MGAKVFKSEAARARLAAWYDMFLAKIPGPTATREFRARLADRVTKFLSRPR